MDKGLEALNKITYCYGYDENIEIVNKSLKALEIIKEKLINLFIVAHTDSKEAYNDMVSEHWRELTQAEYELLKEELL